MESRKQFTRRKYGSSATSGIKVIADRNREPETIDLVLAHVVGTLNLLLMLFLPIFFGMWWIVFEFYEGSILKAIRSLSSQPTILLRCYQLPRVDVAAVFAVWISFQTILYTALPGTICTGQPTPAGEELDYKLNGFRCWTATMIALLTLWATDVIDMAFVASRWGEFLSASAYYAWVLAILAFAKAHLAPSHPKDRIFSGNIFADIYRGVELNPRIGKLWDVKLFHNGHCAMIGWTVIDLSFIALQYEKYGFVTNSIVIVCLIRALVSIDFLWNEHWYLRSIDVCEEPFGYYFTFGSGFFLHSMYTLQSQFLVRHPIILSWGSAVFMLLIGGAGYTIYFIASEQKNMIRETRGNCTIWGKQAECIEVTYMTKDGVTRKTFLICSGLWGIVRHPNYVGALLMTLAMGGACGSGNLFPWTEFIFATIFLAMRSLRDEAKCAKKYGQGWKMYQRKVRWNLVPGVF